jgi:peptide/nickel transport system permease protein
MSPWTPPAGLGRLLLRRSVQVLALALTISTLCVAMLRSLPGDMATRVAAGRYGYDMVTNAAAAEVRAELGLDLPLTHALLQRWQDLALGDLGRSWVSGEPVLHELAEHLQATLVLSGAALALGLLIGLPLGLLFSRPRPGPWLRALQGASLLLRSLPPFLIAVGLMLGVAVYAGLLPVAGTQGAASLLLPALTLALPLAAGVAQVFALSLQQARALPSHQFTCTKGLSDRQALLRHALRHAALPLLAYVGSQAVLLAEGAVVVESLFAWPGIGHALVHAVFGRDLPVIQGAALTMGLLFIAFNAATDAAQVGLDARLRRRSA